MQIRYFFPSLIITLATCWAMPHYLLAQYQSLRFDRITVEDGLPNPSVLDIIQDRQGFMWFGTLSGIVRYDGYEMKSYHLTATVQDSLPTRNVPKLFEDKSGNIWVGFAFSAVWPKLFRYDPSLDRFVPFLFDPGKKENPIGRGISSLRQDRQGRLLVGTWGDGVYAIDIAKFRDGIAPKDLPFLHFRHEPGNKNSLCNDAMARQWAEDTNGNFWIPTDDGLCKFVPGENRFETFRYTADTIPLANEFGCVFFEKPNHLWVGSVLHGLLIFDTASEKFVGQYQHDPNDPHSIAASDVWTIHRAQDGRFWLGVNSGFDIFDPSSGHFTHIKDDSHRNWTANFPHNNALVEDYSGNIWIATWQQGIFKYNPGKGSFHFRKPDKQALPDVTKWYAKCEDRQGNIWFATEDQGAIRWNRQHDTYQRYRYQPGNPNSLSSDRIGGIIEDFTGNIWIGTDAGFDRLDANGNIKRFAPVVEGLAHLHQSTDGTIWLHGFISEPGLCRLTDPRTGAAKCYSSKLENLGGISAITAFEEDENGRIWLGINQWGFYIHDPETDQFEHFAQEFGIHDVHFDRDGHCWLATHSAGLKLWDREKQQIVHLPKYVHDQIGIARGILEDEKGFLWMKTPQGIVQFDPKARQVVRQFDKQNWMAETELWYRWEQSFQTRNGEMFFNSESGGILHFHPDEIRGDTFPPKVAFTGLRLNGKTVALGNGSPLQQIISQTKKLVLRHNQGDIALTFAGLHFKLPAENTYQYRLENHDDDWVPAGKNRTANYTNLPPGDYTFWVRAANSDGKWSEPEPLEITIRSPWYARWWAWMLFIAAGASLFFGGWQYDLRRKLAQAEAHRLQELDELKSRLYTNLTHEFRTPLTVILGMAEELQEGASKSFRKKLKLIQHNGQRLLTMVNQLLDLSKLEAGALQLKLVQGDVVVFLRYLTESFQSYTKQEGLSLVFASQMPGLVMDYDPERLQQVLSNLLANAIKFTPQGGTVQVYISRKGNELAIDVTDTGIGISQKDLPHVFDRFYQVNPENGTSQIRQSNGTGIGLAMAQELVKLMGGELSVRSEMGQGSVFHVQLPITHTAPMAESVPVFDPTYIETQAPAIDELIPSKNGDAPLVLLIEDNADVVTYLRSTLQGSYQLAVAPNGRAGIDRAQALMPDLVVSDVMMPEMDGFEVCRRLKSDWRTSHIPIVLLTAKADFDSKMEGLEHGADAYLTKPFRREELLVRLRKLLDLRQQLQAHYRHLLTGDATAPELVKPLQAKPTEHAFVKKVREAVEAHLDDSSFSIPDLCLELGLSRTQLHRKLTNLSGFSASQYVQHLRVARAKIMLRQDDLTIAEIAYQTGYSSPDYFSKVFKKEMGKTPSEYRSEG